MNWKYRKLKNLAALRYVEMGGGGGGGKQQEGIENRNVLRSGEAAEYISTLICGCLLHTLWSTTQ